MRNRDPDQRRLAPQHDRRHALGNVIAFNGDRGIRIGGNTTVDNAILDNSIFSNSDLGIELGTDG